MNLFWQARTPARGPGPQAGTRERTKGPTETTGGERRSHADKEQRGSLSADEAAPQGQAERGQRQRACTQEANAADGGPLGLDRLRAAFTPRAEPEHHWGRHGEVGRRHSSPRTAHQQMRELRHLEQPQPPCRGWRGQRESAAGLKLLVAGSRARTMAWMSGRAKTSRPGLTRCCKLLTTLPGLH